MRQGHQGDEGHRILTAALGPRLVIAGTHSGVGKTTVATGLMAALRRAGHEVRSAKVGPDFIDPGFHSVATGAPPRNLDAWICGPEAIAPLAGRAGADGDMLIVEGVMGLYDGAVDNTPSSTADIAALIDAPVILVVDGSAMSASVAALVRGYRDHGPDIRLAGVILNRVSSDRHRQLLTEALAAIGVEVLGTLATHDALTWRDRHLGLVPVEEQPTEVTSAIGRLAPLLGDNCNLPRLVELAKTAPRRQVGEPSMPARVVPDGVKPVKLAVAGGKAFTFLYKDNLEAFQAAGAEVVCFDPLNDEAMPDGVDGLFVGGGFPEVFAARLAENQPLAADVRRHIRDGLPTWAECGGLLWLAGSLDGREMLAMIDAEASMTDRLTLGYRSAEVRTSNPVASAGTVLRGHEFHYSNVEPGGDALRLTSRFGTRDEGFATGTIFATYLHQHLGSDPAPAERFVATCHDFRRKRAQEGG